MGGRKPKTSGIKVVRTLVTPYKANKWLEKTKENGFDNRTLREPHIFKYARDMINGRWLESTETIKIDPDGTVIDGQHRLWAVILAEGELKETGVWMHVAYNVPKEIILALDSGIPRGFKDFQDLSGRRNAAALAAAIRLQLMYDMCSNPYGRPSVNGKLTEGRDKVDFRPSFAELEECHLKHPELDEWATHSHLRPQFCSRAVLIWAFYNFANKASKKATLEFVEDLKEGAELKKGDPVLTLRNKLLANHASREKLPSMFIAAYIVKAWNARRKGKTLTNLRWERTSEFPKIAR